MGTSLNKRMVRLAVSGAAGRMGTTIVRCLRRFDDMVLAAALEQPAHEAVGRDAGVVAGIDPLGVLVGSDLEQIAAADVIVDFSFHSAVPAVIHAAVRQQKRVVLGTTGLTEEEARIVREAATTTAVLWAPNMSLGVNLLFNLVARAARVLGPDYDVEITEVHHRHKKDAPSGTALKLGEIVAAERGQTLSQVVCCGRSGNVGERPRGQIGIHAVRLGDVIGEHVVSFGTDGERLELVHRATSREAFAMGALRAARWIVEQPPGLYDMRDVLGLGR